MSFAWSFGAAVNKTCDFQASRIVWKFRKELRTECKKKNAKGRTNDNDDDVCVFVREMWEQRKPIYYFPKENWKKKKRIVKSAKKIFSFDRLVSQHVKIIWGESSSEWWPLWIADFNLWLLISPASIVFDMMTTDRRETVSFINREREK